MLPGFEYLPCLWVLKNSARPHAVRNDVEVIECVAFSVKRRGRPGVAWLPYFMIRISEVL